MTLTNAELRAIVENHASYKMYDGLVVAALVDTLVEAEERLIMRDCPLQHGRCEKGMHTYEALRGLGIADVWPPKEQG